MKLMLSTGLAATLLLCAPVAMAGPSAHIANSQHHHASVATELNGDIRGITGKTSVAAAAIANNLNVEMASDLTITNYQRGQAWVQTDASLRLESVEAADVTVAAITNNAAIKGEGANRLDLSNHQAAEIDPRATLNGTLENIAGDANVAVASVSNNLSVQTHQTMHWTKVDSYQLNHSASYAITKLDMREIGGKVAVSAAAMGNNAYISGLATLGN